MLAVILLLPLSQQTRGQLLNLFGLAFTAVIALSATTVIANAMAGLMLRSVRSFRAGDFIRVEKEFGRVTEVGLFHTEIQTEDRDLTTVPNLFLLSHPVRVVRASGTIVSATVSLGYDVPRKQVETLLLEAARTAQPQPEIPADDLPDELVFDKAEAAESVEKLKIKREELEAEIKKLTAEKGQASGEDKERLAQHIEHRKNQIKHITAAIKSAADTDEKI